MDYEVMSDQDWEEEPEGEELSVSSLKSLFWQDAAVGREPAE